VILGELANFMSWTEDGDLLRDVREAHVALLATRLGELLGRLTAGRHTELADELTGLTHVATTDVLTAVLLAPEVSYRLLWPGHHHDPDAGAFVLRTLRDMLEPEAAPRLSHPILVAARPSVLAADGAVIARWPMAHELPIDVGSPYALTVEVTGDEVRLARPGEPLPAADVRHALAKLHIAATEIPLIAEPAWCMVRDFTQLVILLPDRQAPRDFSSGSSGQFIGRTVLANPHLAKVTPVHLAEALVHEAIHAVLYMDERQSDWVLDPDLYAGPMRITSPWTGHPLPLRPYLQACFVWFGLLAFWSSAIGVTGLDRDKIRERLIQASTGFLRGDLLERVETVRDRLSTEVLEAVAALQSNVLAALPEATSVR
jgi:hypothetical protein